MNITVQNLTVTYRERIILNNISFKLFPGEITVIKGANGTGKSTLCNAICAVTGNYGAVCKGDILYDDKNINSLSVSEKCNFVGYIFQNPDNYLFSSVVEDELAFGPENLCLPVSDIDDRITKALELTGITHLRKRNIKSLSGGEKQLTAIACVLTMNPLFIVADEITSGLDADYCKRIRNLLCSLRDSGKGILMISHNLNDIQICDKEYTLLNGGMLL